MPRVNPEILVWARKTAKMTQEEAADGLGIQSAKGMATEKLDDLEMGRVEPTRPMLLRMAKLYRRPLLVFYMSAPPRTGDRGQDFRSLPDDYSASDDVLIDTLIRNVIARQSILRSLLEDEEETKPLEFVNSAKIAEGKDSLLLKIKNLLKIDHTDFYDQEDNNKAFALVRSKVEAAGVIVLLIGDLGSHHTKINVEVFRGLALADEIVPFIVINDHDSHAAWSFTLLHELVHIFLGQSGISGGWAGMALERFCNDVAGEFLLPTNEITKLQIDPKDSIEEIEKSITQFARKRNLSSSMVAYKLLRSDIIDGPTWTQLTNDFRERWLKNQEEKQGESQEQEGGPSYYTVRQHRVGITLINIIDRMLASGAVTTSKAGKVLGVKPKNVQSLIETTHNS